VLSQVIPDVVKGLVDDGLVDMDKIGGGNFFWALPSKQGQRKKAQLDGLKVCTLFFDAHINLKAGFTSICKQGCSALFELCVYAHV